METVLDHWGRENTIQRVFARGTFPGYEQGRKSMTEGDKSYVAERHGSTIKHMLWTFHGIKTNVKIPLDTRETTLTDQHLPTASLFTVQKLERLTSITASLARGDFSFPVSKTKWEHFKLSPGGESLRVFFTAAFDAPAVPYMPPVQHVHKPVGRSAVVEPGREAKVVAIIAEFLRLRNLKQDPVYGWTFEMPKTTSDSSALVIRSPRVFQRCKGFSNVVAGLPEAANDEAARWVTLKDLLSPTVNERKDVFEFTSEQEPFKKVAFWYEASKRVINESGIIVRTVWSVHTVVLGAPLDPNHPKNSTFPRALGFGEVHFEL